MIDPFKCMLVLDALDPRITPPVYNPDVISLDEVLKSHKKQVEVLLRIMTEDDDNPLRIKGRAVLHAIESQRSTYKP